jgi:hypothetical protein
MREICTSGFGRILFLPKREAAMLRLIREAVAAGEYASTLHQRGTARCRPGLAAATPRRRRTSRHAARPRGGRLAGPARSLSEAGAGARLAEPMRQARHTSTEVALGSRRPATV